MRSLGALTVAAAMTMAATVGAQTEGVAERFTALAVNMSNGGSGTIEMVVNRWSTEAERNRLVTTLMQQGPGQPRRSRCS
jgi:broad specificity polyphosphatase/5'/3'-nucleotidase SurE